MKKTTRERAIEILSLINDAECVLEENGICNKSLALNKDGFDAIRFAIADMKKVDDLEKSVEILKGMTTELLIKFQGDCVKVARENVLESHVEMLGRIFAAVLLHKEYTDVTKEEISNMLVVEEEDAI